ncbi:hypothetical protein JCM10213_000277 [Rhodosporidiobolus nylandii]
MSGRPSRRVIVLAAAGLCSLVLLFHLSSDPKLSRLSSGRLTRWSSTGASTSTFGAAVAHADEASALPLVASIASFALTSPSARAKVAICAVPTHEERFLPEWLTWHRLLGVERFFLFDNAPSRGMRRLLRPWIEEGSVVLYEIDYDEKASIGTVYQTHALRLCEKYVLPNVQWASHHDVDEFLMVDAPGWSSPVPSPAAVPSSATEAAVEPSPGWTYPLHARFAHLDVATCVPILRLPFQNYGVRDLEPGELVTERQTVREQVGPAYHTYGKIFLHSGEKAKVASWMGPHSCKALPDSVVLSAQAQPLVVEREIYPYSGRPLPQEGLYLHHYIQRSLADCYSKYAVLSNTPQDWRAKDGLAGCARNYVPTDAELSAPSSLAALRAEGDTRGVGEELIQRPESWSALFTRDTAARESWQGRMTRTVLDEWRRRGGAGQDWYWETDPAVTDARLDALEDGARVSRVEHVEYEIRGM